MGIDRSRGLAGHWKGYIDEVKVYGRAFTADNVTDACLLYEECEKHVAPKTPTGLTATDPNNGTSINLTWNSVTGADNYTVYWTDDPAHRLIHQILLLMMAQLPSQEPLRLPQG